MAPWKNKPSGANKKIAYPEMELSVLYTTALEEPPLVEKSATALALVLAPEKAIDQEPPKEKKYEFGLDALFQPERLHPRVESLIYWRDKLKSGFVFLAGFVTLMAFAEFSIISLVSFLLLLALVGSFGVRIYTSVMQANPEEGENRFKEYMELDLTLSQERVQQWTLKAVVPINYYAAHLKSLFLFENVFESLNFGATLFTLTLYGHAINALTVIIWAFVAVFTLPKIYETNKEAIDAKLDVMRLKWAKVIDPFRSFLAIDNNNMVAAPEADKDK